MNQLLPIIRRKRRPLIVEAEVKPPVPAISATDKLPEPVAPATVKPESEKPAVESDNLAATESSEDVSEH